MLPTSRDHQAETWILRQAVPRPSTGLLVPQRAVQGYVRHAPPLQVGHRVSEWKPAVDVVSSH